MREQIQTVLFLTVICVDQCVNFIDYVVIMPVDAIVDSLFAHMRDRGNTHEIHPQ